MIEISFDSSKFMVTVDNNETSYSAQGLNAAFTFLALLEAIGSAYPNFLFESHVLFDENDEEYQYFSVNNYHFVLPINYSWYMIKEKEAILLYNHVEILLRYCLSEQKELMRFESVTTLKVENNA